MAGMGTGYPIAFHCPGYREIYWDRRTNADRIAHTITLTGRTRPTRKNNKGHPRKSWTTREWTCLCGRTGWSSHIDLERLEGRTRCDCMTEDPGDGFGERVITHSMSCPEHPEGTTT